MLSKRATGNNSHSSNGHRPFPPGLLEYVPAALRETISESFEREGIMNEPAEQRILRALGENHKDLQGSIGELQKTLYNHDTRLTVVELDVKASKDAADTASTERRNNSRIIKGAFAASLVSIVLSPIVSAMVGFYALRATPPVQESLKTDAAISSKLDKLTDLMIQEREDRKATVETRPASVAVPKSKTHQGRRPEPPRINMLNEKELRAVEPWNAASLRHYSLTKGGL